MRSLGSRQTLSGCLKGCSPDELRNGVDDSNQRGPRKGIGLVPQYFGRSKPSMAPSRRLLRGKIRQQSKVEQTFDISSV